MKINWIFFGFYFVVTAVIHILHVFLIDPVINSSTYLFASYTLFQCALETGILILGASWIQQAFPRWMNFYILVVFFLFLTHLIDFALVRFVDMSFWYAVHFTSQETYANFIELLVASNISFLIWISLGLGGVTLILSGLFLYRMTDPWRRIVKPLPFFLTLGMMSLAFISLDHRVSTTESILCFDRLEKALPWKKTLFATPHPSLLLDAPLQRVASEEELLRHLDSRAFSLKHQPDIYLFIIESLRNDFITQEIAPHLYQFKQENISFQTTFSNANATHLSWYSLFHSRFPFEWKKASLEEKKQGSLPLRLLKKMGYKIHVSSSTTLNFYQMNQILFGNGEYLADSLFTPHKECTELYLRDRATMDHLITQMQTPGSGRVFILFLDATHFDYSWPKETTPFFPYQNKIDYLDALFSKKASEGLINRYKNAVYFIDTLFAQFSNALMATPGGQDAAIIITGDHGEEFYEQGNLFHTSELSYQQITPPLYYRLGKNAAVKEWVQCNTTCHMDIFPSLFHYLIGEDLMQPVLQGQSIFREDRWPFTLIARFNASRVPYEYCIHNDTNKLIFALSNDADPFSSRELKILSKRNLHDDTLPQDASALQEEFGPALKHLFSSPKQ